MQILRNSIDQLFQDARYAIRTMANNRTFTMLAVLSLALGIGANTAIFSFVDAILVRSLPVQDPQSLVVLKWRAKDQPGVLHSSSGTSYRDPKLGFTSASLPYPALEIFQAQTGIFGKVFGFRNAGRLNVLVRGQAGPADGFYVTADFFSGLGVVPVAGRLIGPGDDGAGAAATAVISHKLWQSRFGGHADAIGAAVLINNKPFTIIGVTAPDFFGVDAQRTPDVYLPIQTQVLFELPGAPFSGKQFSDRNFYWLEMMARLRPGVRIEQAGQALAGVFHQFVESTASNDRERSDLPVLVLQEGSGGMEYLRRQYSRPLYVLLTLVGVILSIACANLANLQLARAAARRREMAVRLSIGASRARVIRQLLTESVLLACCGGLAGTFVAVLGIRFLTFLLANGAENFTLRAELNGPVLAAATGLSILTGLLFGLAPAIQATRVDLVPALKETRAGTQSRAAVRGSWVRVGLGQMLLVSQIALTLLMLVAAGLFVRTLSNLHSVTLGFNAENILLFTVNARQAGYSNDPTGQDPSLARFYEELQRQMSTIAGVRDVTLSNYALLSGSASNFGVTVPGSLQQRQRGITFVLNVGPSFFTTMQISILLGRDIDERDRFGAPQVAIVNEVFARTHFGNDNPLGRRFSFGGPQQIEIVGVAKAARYASLTTDIPPTVYLPYRQDLRGMSQATTFALRTAGNPLAHIGAVRQIVEGIDPRVPISEVRTQAAQVDRSIGQSVTFARLCTAFAVLALVIACVGLYATVAYGVERRTNEIGIRMALGAQRGRLIWLILRQVTLLVGLGLAVGLPITYATSTFVKSFLFGLNANDPLTIAVAVGLLVACALAAAYGPAWRASRIDPMTALRHE